METFVEIINTAKVRSNTNLELSGIFANKKRMGKAFFLPASWDCWCNNS